MPDTSLYVLDVLSYVALLKFLHTKEKPNPEKVNVSLLLNSHNNFLN